MDQMPVSHINQSNTLLIIKTNTWTNVQENRPVFSLVNYVFLEDLVVQGARLANCHGHDDEQRAIRGKMRVNKVILMWIGGPPVSVSVSQCIVNADFAFGSTRSNTLQRDEFFAISSSMFYYLAETPIVRAHAAQTVRVHRTLFARIVIPQRVGLPSLDLAKRAID